MSTNPSGPLSVNSIFLDENTWLRNSLVQTLFMEMKKTGVIEDLINLSLNKRKFKGTKDDELFNWLIRTMSEKQRVWLITRDKDIFTHIPVFFRNQVLVLRNIEEIKLFTEQIRLYCIIIIILQCVNIKARKLIKELTKLLHNYIEEVICELKFT